MGFGFFIAYYFAVFFIGAILFITKMHDIAFFVVFLISLFMVVLIECYCWCHLVDSLDDVVSTMFETYSFGRNILSLSIHRQTALGKAYTSYAQNFRTLENTILTLWQCEQV